MCLGIAKGTYYDNKIKQFASPVYGDGISKRFIEIFRTYGPVFGVGCSGASQFAYGFLGRLCLGNSGLDQVQVWAHTYLRYV